MKRIFLVLLLCAFLLTGCSDKPFTSKRSFRPFIIFNSAPITPESKPEYAFPAGKRVYYAAVMPKGFKEKVIKVQIFKKDEKSEFWGYSYFTNRTCEVRYDNFYRDYVVINQKGHYVMQVFYLSDLQRPLIMADFRVVE